MFYTNPIQVQSSAVTITVLNPPKDAGGGGAGGEAPAAEA